MRKSFETSAETTAILKVLIAMQMGEQIGFGDLSRRVGFTVNSTTPAYHSARRMAERDHGIFIGSIRGTGCFRGTGEDMANSLEQMAASMRRTAKKSVKRADLAIANNLPDDVYHRTVERRNRASIIHSTSAAPMPSSNRKRPAPAEEAQPTATFAALRGVK